MLSDMTESSTMKLESLAGRPVRFRQRGSAIFNTDSFLSHLLTVTPLTLLFTDPPFLCFSSFEFSPDLLGPDVATRRFSAADKLKSSFYWTRDQPHTHLRTERHRLTCIGKDPLQYIYITFTSTHWAHPYISVYLTCSRSLVPACSNHWGFM